MDTSIVLRTKSGDVSAFTELYNQTHDKAYSVAYSIMKDEFEAEDIVQEAYIVVMEKLDDLKNPDRFESWFYQIVRTRSLNDLKKKRPTTFTSLESIDNPDLQFVDTLESDYKPFNPEASVDEAETRRLVRDMVFSLPEMQKKCILMRYQGDMKVCDIAKALNIPESTVKSNLNYGRKKIEESVRSMEKKGVKLYSFSPNLVLPLLREALYIGLASSGKQDDSNSGKGSVLAEAGRESVRVIVRRAIAAICATFAIGGGAIGLSSKQPISHPETTAAVQQTAPAPETMAVPTPEPAVPAAPEAAPQVTAAESPAPSQPEVLRTVPKDATADSLVTLWKEGSFPGSRPVTYRLPALALGYGDDSAFRAWVNNFYRSLANNLEHYDIYWREYYHYEGDLHFDYVSEIFGNVLTVMFTVNDYPISSIDRSISYDLTTGRKLTTDQLVEYSGFSKEYLYDQILIELESHWAMEDSTYGHLEGVDALREKTLASDLWNNTSVIIQPHCKGLADDPYSYASVSLCFPIYYWIGSDDYSACVYEDPIGDLWSCETPILATDFKAQ